MYCSREETKQTNMAIDIDWLQCVTIAQYASRYVIVLVAVQFLWSFWRRVRRRVKAREKQRVGQEFLELNNNNSSVTGHEYRLTHGRPLMCHKSTQWQEQPGQVTKLAVNYDKVSSANRKQIEGQQPHVLLTRSRNAEEGLTAHKIKQLMTITTASFKAQRADKRIGAQLGSVKTLNGHVNDLKMRFEDGDVKELKPFQNAVDNVAALNRVALFWGSEEVKGNTELQNEEDAINVEVTASDESAEEDSGLEQTIIMRQKNYEPQQGLSNRLESYKLLNEFGGSVHSLEDILNQQRFSRSLSQYSVSDLCRGESPAQINKDCDKFDELFSRSTDDLRNLNGSYNSKFVSKSGSMVNVVNV